jgi:hypothetical protein
MTGAPYAKLARIVIDGRQSVPSSGGLANWLREYGLGHPRGNTLLLSDVDRQTLRSVLEGRSIDVEALGKCDAKPSRTDMHHMTGDEKSGAAAVGRNQSLVRSMPGNPLLVGGTSLMLPAGSSLNIENDLIVRRCEHRSVLVVENRECFDRMEDVDFPHRCFEDNPLVVFRIGPGVSQGAMRLIRALGLPIDVYGDVDPAGLAIAGRIPNARSFVHPPMEVLERIANRNSLHDRYASQLKGAADQRKEHPAWLDHLWTFVERHQCSIPQEAHHPRPF